jgi:hypothetical protein
VSLELQGDFDSATTIPPLKEHYGALFIDLWALAWDIAVAPVDVAEKREHERIRTQIRSRIGAVAHEILGHFALLARSQLMPEPEPHVDVLTDLVVLQLAQVGNIEPARVKRSL